jgi:hypothetical protein
LKLKLNTNGSEYAEMYNKVIAIIFNNKDNSKLCKYGRDRKKIAKCPIITITIG